MMEELWQILEKYIIYLQVQNYSEHTIRNYRDELIRFFCFVKNYKEINTAVTNFNMLIIAEIKQSDVLSYMFYCINTRNNSYFSRKSKLSAIRCFYRWLIMLKKCNTNPALDVGAGIYIKKERDYLKLEEAKKLIGVFNRKNSKNYIRDNAIVHLLLSSGIRKSELYKVKICDVNLNNNTMIIIQGKGHLDRIAYFSKACKNDLEKYLKTRKILDKEDKLFDVKPKEVEHVCKKAYALIGVGDRGLTVHSLRHTAATILYESTRNIYIVNQFLGHTSLTSTEFYTHVSPDILKETVNANPLNNYRSERCR